MPQTPDTDKQPLVSPSLKKVNDFLYHSVADTYPENASPLCSTRPADYGLCGGEDFQGLRPGSPTAVDSVTSTLSKTPVALSSTPADGTANVNIQQSRCEDTENLLETGFDDRKKVILVTSTHPHRSTVNSFAYQLSRISILDRLTFAIGRVCGWICTCHRAIIRPDETVQTRHQQNICESESEPGVALTRPLDSDSGYLSVPLAEGDNLPIKEGSAHEDVLDMNSTEYAFLEQQPVSFCIGSDTDLESEEEQECNTAKFASDNSDKENFQVARLIQQHDTGQKSSLSSELSVFHSKPNYQLRNKWTSSSHLSPVSLVKSKRNHVHLPSFYQAREKHDGAFTRGRLELLIESEHEQEAGFQDKIRIGKMGNLSSPQSFQLRRRPVFECTAESNSSTRVCSLESRNYAASDTAAQVTPCSSCANS